LTSSLRGGVLLLAAIAAAQPETCPMAIAGAIEQADRNGACGKDADFIVITRKCV